jgi:glyoxylase-like metal-dependent hydrolase (beta-lactamase superfamily II)
MLTVGGANFALLTGEQGAVVIDGGGQDCEAVVAAVRQITEGPIRYVLETSADADRIGCVGALAATGRQFGARGGGGGPGGRVGAPIYAHQNVLLRLSQQPAAQANAPSETFRRSTNNFAVNGQGIQMMSMPAAHTDADTIVVLRQADVIVTGNIFDSTRFPVIDVDSGGTVQGEIAALNRLVEELTIPSTPVWQGWYGTLVIPARGPLANQKDLVQYRDMVTIVRDRVASLIKQGKNLEQVQAADPARGFKARYGAETGPWTSRNFVEAVFRSLQAQRRQTR